MGKATNSFHPALFQTKPEGFLCHHVIWKQAGNTSSAPSRSNGRVEQLKGSQRPAARAVLVSGGSVAASSPTYLYYSQMTSPGRDPNELRTALAEGKVLCVRVCPDVSTASDTGADGGGRSIRTGQL